MKVSKFGGTSVASATQIQKVQGIMESDADRKFLVVSAPGKRSDDDTKTTDLLIDCAEQYLENTDRKEEAFERVVGRFQEIIDELNLGQALMAEVRRDLQARVEADQTDEARFVDQMKAGGEDNNAKIVAAYLRQSGLEATYKNPQDAGLLVSDEVGNARVLPESYDNLYKLRDESGIIVFPGFFGYSPEGNLVTFPRGGSDITGAILAAGVKAELYENFTDVDSVYAVNPTLVDHPQEIKALTYKEMRELSYAGFGVFHEEALAPAVRAGIPVCIKNTNNPGAEGTMIMSEREQTENPVVGIASDKGFVSIQVEKYLMNRELGFGRKLLQLFEEEGLSYEHTPSGIDSISVILRANQMDDAKEERLLQRIKNELHVDTISVERDYALIMIVGEAMHEKVGVAAQAVSAIQSAEVNIEMINQSASEISMMFGVKESEADRAVAAIYKEYFERNAFGKELLEQVR